MDDERIERQIMQVISIHVNLSIILERFDESGMRQKDEFRNVPSDRFDSLMAFYLLR